MRSRALSVLLVLAAAACSSSPIPQPPPDDLDTGKIHFPESQPATTIIEFYGDPGAAPPNSIIRVTNLDTTDPPAAIQVASDGSFSATLGGEFHDEFRFQVRIGEERKPPVDLRYIGGAFDTAPRLDCFVVALETDLGSAPIGEPTGATLTLQNDCSADADVQMIALRTGDPDYAVPDMPPSAVAAGASETLDLTLTPSAEGETEEVLLVRVQVDGESARYPITLFGAGE